MDTVLALVRSEADRKAFQSGLAKCATIRFCTRREELRAEAAEAKPTLIVCELTDHDGQLVQPVLKALHTREPWLPIYLYIPLALPDVRDAFGFVKDGLAAGALFRGIDQPAKALRQLLARVKVQGETAKMLRIVTSLMPPTAVPIATACVTASERPAHVEDLAAILDSSPRTIEWQLRRADLPSPQRLLGWCRLLRVASRMAQGGTSLKVIAERLGYSSAAALVQHLRRQSGLTSGALRHGGFHVVHAAFAAEILLGRRATQVRHLKHPPDDTREHQSDANAGQHGRGSTP